MGEQINTKSTPLRGDEQYPTDPGSGPAVPAVGPAGPAAGRSDPREGRRYRAHAAKPRRRQIKVLVDDEEWAALNAAAGEVGGLTLAGWLGLVASDAAVNRPLVSGQQYAGVRELSRQLRRVGVNLNQIAAKLNSGGEVEGLELAAVLEVLQRLLGQSAAVMEDMSQVMRAGRGPGGSEGSAR